MNFSSYPKLAGLTLPLLNFYWEIKKFLKGCSAPHLWNWGTFPSGGKHDRPCSTHWDRYYPGPASGKKLLPQILVMIARGSFCYTKVGS